MLENCLRHLGISPTHSKADEKKGMVIEYG